eukprot:m.161751 g.161751  ORF g.161751 m.161751 type:complete len:445 (-) comp18053_c0_seq1:119-1453(-)
MLRLVGGFKRRLFAHVCNLQHRRRLAQVVHISPENPHLNDLECFDSFKGKWTGCNLTMTYRRRISTSCFAQNVEHNHISSFNDDMFHKLDTLLEDYRSLQAQRDTADAGSTTQADLNKRLNSKAGLVDAIERLNELRQNGNELKELLGDDDAEMREAAELEWDQHIGLVRAAERHLISELVPAEAVDKGNAVVEIRPGTGGREASLFALDLWKMYERCAKRHGWKIEAVNILDNTDGGVRHLSAVLSGRSVYGFLRHETGVHRVQRVPVTETQGRVHTSTAVVAVLPEPTKQDLPEVSEKDIEVDTFKSSGAGGQHVNTTDSAVRLTHTPTGIVVECQNERSQHKNRAHALKMLRAKIFAMMREKEEEERQAEKRRLVGEVTGARSDRIRTYNIPQDRVTDHRCGSDASANTVLLQDGVESIIDAMHHTDRTNRLASSILTLKI